MKNLLNMSIYYANFFTRIKNLIYSWLGEKRRNNRSNHGINSPVWGATGMKFILFVAVLITGDLGKYFLFFNPLV